jgi:hypothetical protein
VWREENVVDILLKLKETEKWNKKLGSKWLYANAEISNKKVVSSNNTT